MSSEQRALEKALELKAQHAAGEWRICTCGDYPHRPEFQSWQGAFFCTLCDSRETCLTAVQERAQRPGLWRRVVSLCHRIYHPIHFRGLYGHCGRGK